MGVLGEGGLPGGQIQNSPNVQPLVPSVSSQQTNQNTHSSVPVSSNNSQVSSQRTSTTTAPDPEKRRLIQQQLVLLLHAHECQGRENLANEESKMCILPHCKTMKNILKHMATCQAGKTCSVQHCSSSKQIISHWKHCTRPHCTICLPLKQVDKNRNNPNATTSTPSTTSQPNPSSSDMRRAYGALGIQCPSTSAGSNSNAAGPHLISGIGTSVSTVGMRPSSTVSHTPISLPSQINTSTISQTQLPGINVNISSTGISSMNQQNIVVPNVALDPATNTVIGNNQPALQTQSSVVHTPILQAIVSTSSFINNSEMSHNSNLNVSMTSGAESRILNIPLGNNNNNNSTNIQTSHIVATPQQGVKEWHQSITSDLRDHLVQKLVQAILPTSGSQAVIDNNIMQNLVSYARKVECDIYEIAASESEYYHLLAAKYYEIQKELDEILEMRKEQQRQQQQQSPNCTIAPPQQPQPNTSQQSAASLQSQPWSQQ